MSRVSACIIVNYADALRAMVLGILVLHPRDSNTLLEGEHTSEFASYNEKAPRDQEKSKVSFNSSPFAKVHNAIDLDLLSQAGEVEYTELC